MRNLGRLGVDLTNVHAAGGYKMMAAAKKGLHDGSVDGHEPKLIAVTQLTSTSSLMLKDELLVEHSMQQTIVKYAQNAKRAGLDGVVCSPLESPMIHEACGMEFLTCTPGIRFTSNSSDDQVRVTTPYKAHRLGSDYIVVGRSITKADNPVEAYREAVKQFVEGIKEWKN
jgi:orotidine-5'-phosphate decarboxylase